VVDSLRALIGAERMVLVDAGNIHSFKKDDAAVREAGFILKMMGRQKYNLAVMGPKDYALPDSLRQAMLAASAFPWIGTNFAESGRPKGVQEVWIQKFDGVRVGVFSYVDPSWIANNMKAEEIADNLEATARDLAKRCDVVAMVAFTDVNNPEPLARRVNGLVDMMILGGVNTPWMTPRREGSVTIGNAGDRGRHIARFDLLLNKEKKLVATDYQVVVLGHDLPVDPVVTQLMDDFKLEQERVKQAALEKLRLEKLALLNLKAADMPGAGSPLRYTGEKDCRECHMDQHNSWRQTVHGRTFSDLIRNRESENEQKVKRSVTGWLEESGFVDRRESSHLYNVQCESCHGRGSEHVKSKGGALETLIKPETTCLRCHDTTNSPNFDLQAGLKLAHPALAATPVTAPKGPESTAPKATLTPGDKLKLGDKAPAATKPKPTSTALPPTQRGTTPVSPPPGDKKN